jgi:hypothetical protein
MTVSPWSGSCNRVGGAMKKTVKVVQEVRAVQEEKPAQEQFKATRPKDSLLKFPPP